MPPTELQIELRALVAALGELVRDSIRAAADAELSPDEVAELAEDVVALGQAIKDLATPNPATAIRVASIRAAVKARREARRLVRVAARAARRKAAKDAR